MASQTAERYALQAAQKAHADQQKLERLARTHPFLRELIAERDQLRAEVAALKAGKAPAKTR